MATTDEGKGKLIPTSVALTKLERGFLENLGFERSLKGEKNPSISAAVRYLVAEEIERRRDGGVVEFFAGPGTTRYMDVETAETTAAPSPSPGPSDEDVVEEYEEPPAPRARPSGSPSLSPSASDFTEKKATKKKT